jgi:small-conductance mechanosensitive channel
MSRQATGSSSVTRKVVEFILLIAGSIVAASVAYALSVRGLIPEEFVLPIYVVVVLAGGYLAIRIISAMLETIIKPRLGVTPTHGIKNLFQIVATIALVAITATIYHYDVTSVLIGAGFLGIVLGLAAQQVLGNVFAGLSLLASRPFEIGDRITLATSSYGLLGTTYAHEAQVNGFTGVISDIGIFFTEVLLDDGNPSVFPNSVVLGSLIINHTRSPSHNVRVRLDVDKKVDYTAFRPKMLDSLRRFEQVDAQKSKIETVDLGATTYQVAITVWTSNKDNDPLKTFIIQEAMRITKELATTSTS